MKAFNTNEAYKSEAQARWGDTAAYKEHAEKTKGYGEDKWNGLGEAMDAVFGDFALCMKDGAASDGEQAQSLVKRLQTHITENHYNCTKQILFGLGQMYVADERFKVNIDRHGVGTAAYVSEAIAAYCK